MTDVLSMLVNAGDDLRREATNVEALAEIADEMKARGDVMGNGDVFYVEIRRMPNLAFGAIVFDNLHDAPPVS